MIFFYFFSCLIQGRECDISTKYSVHKYCECSKVSVSLKIKVKKAKMGARLFKRFLLIGILCLCPYIIHGQKVGLVLSGGGAKGIAHIGVIKALEENNIPIDYVTGTSMGAIVAAFYAMGYTPEEMLELIKSKEFSTWSTGEISPSNMYYFRKPDPTPAFISFKLSGTKGLSNVLPDSYINPLPMNLGFLVVFAPYTAVCRGNFDNLFVPFRAVAADIFDKKAVVFSSGDLGDAVRASMTFPLVFKPLEIDSIPMFDGGIYNNYPVDVMKEDFAPDFIIGSNVTTEKEKNHNTKDIIGQIESMVMQKTDYHIPGEIGISIHSDMHKYSLLDFPKADEIMQIGYNTALEYIDSIKVRVKREESQEERNEKRQKFKEKVPPLIFDEIEVTGTQSNRVKSYISRQFDLREGDSLDIGEVKQAYYQLLSDARLSDLIPHGIYNDTTGKYTLTLQGKMQPKHSIGFGGYISSGNTNLLYLDAKYQTLKVLSSTLALNGYVGRSYYSGRFAVRFELPTHIPTYLKLNGVVSRKKYYESEELFKIEELPTFITTNESYIRLHFGMPVGIPARTEISSGYGYLWDTYYPTNVYDYTVNADRSSYWLGITSADFDYNTLNAPIYATAGSRYRITGSVVYGTETYTPYWETRSKQFHTWLQLSAKIEHYFQMLPHITVGIRGELFASTKKRLQSYTGTIVQAPGFTPTPHSQMVFNEGFHANEYIAGGVMPIYKVLKNMQLRGEFYAFSPFRKILRDDDYSAKYADGYFTHIEFLGEISLVYKLPFATLSAFANYYTYPSNNWNFGFALGFLLYNPRFLYP